MPPSPLLHFGHTAIVYETFTTRDLHNMCPGNKCGPYCLTTSSDCYIMDKNDAGTLVTRDPTDGTLGGRGDLPVQGGLSTGLDITSKDCPDKCCSAPNENCYRIRDSVGQVVEVDEEIMLVFGGKTIRNKKDTNGNLLYDVCEDHPSDSRPDKWKSCGEELLNELWRYHILRDTWSYIKPDYNRLVYSRYTSPSSRYDHAASYVEIENIESGSNNQKVKRKYMYIYGGFSFDCTTACKDLWRYEIPYAPQRFYPEPKQTSQWWNRGNHWELKKNDTVNSPGNRWKHKMISDYTMENLFLFGGIVVSQASGNEYMNDMWKYYIFADKWEEIIPFGINAASRKVNLWNGLFEDVPVDTSELKKDDVITFLPHYEHQTLPVEIPPARAGHTMTLLGNPAYYILIFGGFYKATVVEDGSTNYIHKVLDDMWSYSIYSQKWQEVFVNSLVNPTERQNAQMVTAKIDRLAIMFGGHYSDNSMNDMWYYNIYTNIWQEFKYQTDGDFVIPPKLKDFSFVSAKIGLVIYGGVTWTPTDLTKVDEDQARRSKFENDCQAIATAKGLTLADANSPAWIAAYASTGNACFAPYIDTVRSLAINKDAFFFPSAECKDPANPAMANCNGVGVCSYGRCTCKVNFYGKYCQNPRCPGSLCYIDIDTTEQIECFHCSGRGDCNNGVCTCHQGYVGSDCATRDCQENCSGNDHGTCTLLFPQAQCDCNEENHYGGEKCEVQFCLNDCGTFGKCESGQCSCDAKYYGEDCTVYGYDVSEKEV